MSGAAESDSTPSDPVNNRPTVGDAYGASDEAAAAAARAQGRLILVAEDNLSNQQVLRQQLSVLGFDCDIESDGAAALQALRRQPYLLVLCDCHMPAMDGFELTRIIRAGEVPGGTHLPIIAITANAMRGDSDRCHSAGMDDYIAKPVEIGRLQSVLARWLGAKWRPAALEQSAVSEAPAPGRIDLTNLATLYGNDVVRIKPVLDQWRTVMEAACAALRHAVSESRWGDVGVAAHCIKGTAGTAGARELSAGAAALERAVRAGVAVSIAGEAARVLAEAAGALAEAKAWNGTLAGSVGHRSAGSGQAPSGVPSATSI